jgi:hypothetical protein
MRFTSYINNLHPGKHHEAYRIIEKLIDVAIPAWNHCLSEYSPLAQPEPRRSKSRISVPDGAYDDNDELWEPMDQALKRHNVQLSTDQLLEIAEELDLDLEDELSQEGEAEDLELLDDSAERDRQAAFILKKHADEINEWKWKQIREPIIPEPEEFSEDDFDYSRAQSLQEKFRENGLQVIVKMATIELTPEKPEFPVGGWHVSCAFLHLDGLHPS